MYCPKIKPELVKRLYKLKDSEKKKVPMTQLVSEAIEEYLNKHENKTEAKK